MIEFIAKEEFHWWRGGNVLCVTGERDGLKVASCELHEWVSVGPSIWTVAVHPAHRRQGIATAMLKFVIEHAAAANKQTLSLWVSDDNTIAKRLYESLGFVVASREKDACVMAMRLGQREAVSA